MWTRWAELAERAVIALEEIADALQDRNRALAEDRQELAQMQTELEEVIERNGRTVARER